MKKIFTCVLLVCALCLMVIPAQSALGLDWNETSLGKNAQVYVSPDYDADNSAYALMAESLYLSQDGGVSWKQVSTLPVLYVHIAPDKKIYSLLEESERQLAIYSYDSTQNEWQKKCNAPAKTKMFALLTSNILLATMPHEDSNLWQLMRSVDGGSLWNYEDFNYGGSQLMPMPDGNTVFAIQLSNSQGHYSTDGGEKWKQFSKAFSFERFFVSNYSKPFKVFAICYKTQIYCTTDLGDNWFPADRGLNKTFPFVDIAFSPNYTSDNTFYVADNQGRVQISNTEDLRWWALDLELPAGVTLNSLAALPDRNLLAGTNNGVYVTTQATVIDRNNIPAKPTNVTTRSANARFQIGSFHYYINGQQWEMDTVPYQENNRSYVPVRFLAYGLGLKDEDITWTGKNQEVTITKDGTVVKLRVGSPLLYVNQREVRMDVTPQLDSVGRVMLPARWVAEAFGAEVSWDERNKIVTIRYEYEEAN